MDYIQVRNKEMILSLISGTIIFCERKSQCIYFKTLRFSKENTDIIPVFIALLFTILNI